MITQASTMPPITTTLHQSFINSTVTTVIAQAISQPSIISTVAPTSSTTTSTMSYQAPIHYAAPSRLNLLPFNKSDPILWFSTAEIQFRSAGIISDEDKYAQTLGVLPIEVIQEVRDILLQPPAIQPFQNLRNVLIQRLSTSLEERLQRLLREETLGDRRPTQLLIRMKSLASDCQTNLDSNILKTLFLQRMPENVREILSITAETTPVDQLAELADKILRANPRLVNAPALHHTPSLQPISAQQYSALTHANVTPAPHQLTAPLSLPSAQSTLSHGNINEISYYPQPMTFPNNLASCNATYPTEISALVASVKDLTISVNKLLAETKRSRSRERDRTYSPRRSRNNSPSPNNHKYCYYHHRFGDNARKCNSETCTYKSSGN